MYGGKYFGHSDDFENEEATDHHIPVPGKPGRGWPLSGTESDAGSRRGGRHRGVEAHHGKDLLDVVFNLTA